MSGIYWLSSYPKSGNTWVRTLLSNYFSNTRGAVKVNQLMPAWAYISEWFETTLGVDRQDLTPRQIYRYRPLAYEAVARNAAHPVFSKIHDAFENNCDGVPVFPPAATEGVLYMVRNPLDVAVSYAHHLNVSIDETIEHMGDDNAYLAGAWTNYTQLPQKLASWSEHVRSWLDAPDMRIKVIRYEEMLANPTKVFKDIIKFCKLDIDKKKLEKSVRLSRFEVLKKQEKNIGFKEKQPTAASFFRQGKAGDWSSKLTVVQVEKIVSRHGDMMRRLDYL